MEDGGKRFQVRIRARDSSVTEIPALAFSWFDPKTETYQTTRSSPVALRVDDADRVGQSDVYVASKEKDAPGTESTGASGRPSSGDEVGDLMQEENQAAVHADALSGADLAIESDARKVLHQKSKGTIRLTTQLALHGAGLLAIVVALVDRRRRNIDPRIVEQRQEVKQLVQQIRGARHQNRSTAAEMIAHSLRGLMARLPEATRDTLAAGAALGGTSPGGTSLRTETEAIIAECETLIYAPGEAEELSVDRSLWERAQQVASEYIKEVP